MTANTDTARNQRRVLRGVVSSDKMDKSITVRVERTTRHPKYGKYVRRHQNHVAHDEENQARLGDTVEITSTRPLSKRKRWRLSQIVNQTKDVEASSAEATDVINEAVTHAEGTESGPTDAGGGES